MDINRTQIAKATNTDLAHISRIFSGKANPSLPLAIKIASYLGVSLDEFVRIIRPQP